MFCPYNLPRKKVKSIRISSASSIDGNRSTATSIKSDTPVSGGAYQDARKVTTEWNAKPKHWGLPKIRCRKHPTVTKRPFSPPSFPARRKRRGRRRRVRNDHDGTSRRKRRLFSSVLVSSFPNRKLNLRFGFFPADLQQPLSQPDGCQHPYPFCPFGTFPPDRGNRPLEGEPLPPNNCRCGNGRSVVL